eukprot:1159810-Pelagomonas_calceolata.AAC.3
MVGKDPTACAHSEVQQGRDETGFMPALCNYLSTNESRCGLRLLAQHRLLSAKSANGTSLFTPLLPAISGTCRHSSIDHATLLSNFCVLNVCQEAPGEEPENWQSSCQNRAPKKWPLAWHTDSDGLALTWEHRLEGPWAKGPFLDKVSEYQYIPRFDGNPAPHPWLELLPDLVYTPQTHKHLFLVPQLGRAYLGGMLNKYRYLIPRAAADKVYAAEAELDLLFREYFKTADASGNGVLEHEELVYLVNDIPGLSTKERSWGARAQLACFALTKVMERAPTSLPHNRCTIQTAMLPQCAQAGEWIQDSKEADTSLSLATCPL